MLLHSSSLLLKLYPDADCNNSSTATAFKPTSCTLRGTSFMELGSTKMPSLTIPTSVQKYSIRISAYVISIRTIDFMYIMLTKISFKLTLPTKLSGFQYTSRTNGLRSFTLPSNTNTRPLIASNPSPHKTSMIASA